MLHSLYNYFSLASLFGSILNSEWLRIEVSLGLEIFSLFSFIEEGLHMTQIIIAKHFKGGNLGIVFQHLILASWFLNWRENHDVNENGNDAKQKF